VKVNRHQGNTKDMAHHLRLRRWRTWNIF